MVNMCFQQCETNHSVYLYCVCFFPHKIIASHNGLSVFERWVMAMCPECQSPKLFAVKNVSFSEPKDIGGNFPSCKISALQDTNLNFQESSLPWDGLNFNDKSWVYPRFMGNWNSFIKVYWRKIEKQREHCDKNSGVWHFKTKLLKKDLRRLGNVPFCQKQKHEK